VAARAALLLPVAALTLAALCGCRSTGEAPPELPPVVPQAEVKHPAVRMAFEEYRELSQKNAMLTAETDALPRDSRVEVMKRMAGIVRQVRLNNESRTRILLALLDMAGNPGARAQALSALDVLRVVFETADVRTMRGLETRDDARAAYQRALLAADIRPVDLMFDLPADAVVQRLEAVAELCAEDEQMQTALTRVIRLLD
jgi:hypothetical protein